MSDKKNSKNQLKTGKLKDTAKIQLSKKVKPKTGQSVVNTSKAAETINDTTGIINAKNLITIGITAAAVILFSLIMTFMMPKDNKSDTFDPNSWQDNISSSFPAQSAAANADTLPVDTYDTSNQSQSETETEQSETTSPIAETSAAPTLTVPVGGGILNDYSGDNLVFSNTMQDWRTHNGIDFAANDGTVVQASADGTVEAITNNGMDGTTVIILHDGGLRTIYSNLSEDITVNIGDNVLCGAPIGKVGDTSALEAADAPHLHFEVSLNEETVNPHDYMNFDVQTWADYE